MGSKAPETRPRAFLRGFSRTLTPCLVAALLIEVAFGLAATVGNLRQAAAQAAPPAPAAQFVSPDIRGSTLHVPK